MIAGQLQTFASFAGSEETDKLVKKIDLRSAFYTADYAFEIARFAKVVA